jgi:predicted DNA repair protein MutK
VERDKVKGAIRTDFILSAEIVAITLGIVADQGFATQVAVLSGIAVVMTIGVYGLVAGIVKLDDAGLYLTNATGTGGWVDAKRAFGRGILRAAPYLMRTLSVVGTAAMFLVGGGILVHGVPAAYEWVHHLAEQAGAFGGGLAMVTPLVVNLVVGLTTGALVLAGLSIVQRVRGTGGP